MNVDFAEMAREAESLMQSLHGARHAHLTSPGGTDLHLDLNGRDFMTDAIVRDGRWGNLPPGEIWCGPVEDGAEGRLVCDGSIGDLGAVPTPVRIEVKRGRVTLVRCDDAGFCKRVQELLALDDQASVIGELGIGLNPRARITGNMLEDEKVKGTAHIAFGNNSDMPGGRNTSRTHRDFLVRQPTLNVEHADGSQRTVVG